MDSILQQFDIKGRSALITGAASGIGLAMAEAMAEAGAKVTLTDRKGDVAEERAATLREKGYTVRGTGLNVTDNERCGQVFDEHVAAYGGLNICFANAGTGAGSGWKAGDGSRTVDGQIDTIDPEVWDHVVNVNMGGAVNTTRHAARVMKQCGNKGSIIVTTSNASQITVPMVCTAYMLAKAGVAHYVRNLARELAEFDIRVNAIAPGSFVTNIGGGHLHRPEVQEVWRNMVPLGRLGDCKRIKPLSLYLASDASDFMTGAELVVDGGVSLVSSY